ncbi:MAG: flagellar motor switch protein FliN [Sedimentisphaerales bacterium]|nr:flagellar motor switch protein FliN [Sedimentisphaerales bacterium]
MPEQESQNQDSEVSQESSPPEESSTSQEGLVAGADSARQTAPEAESAGEIDEQAGNEAAVAAEVAELMSEAAETSEQTEQSPDLPDFSGMFADAAASSIELLNDVELDVKVELGRSELSVEEILKLSEGSVVELDKLAGDPVDILVNEQLIARGEVLVVNDNFCVRINEIIPGISETVNQT